MPNALKGCTNDVSMIDLPSKLFPLVLGCWAGSLATAPLRGESRDDLLPGLRHLALDRAVYCFRSRAEQRDIHVLAVFFGGQDHQRRMLVRLLQNSAQA